MENAIPNVNSSRTQDVDPPIHNVIILEPHLDRKKNFFFNIFLLIQFNAGNENPRSFKREYLNAHRHPAASFVDWFELIE